MARFGRATTANHGFHVPVLLDEVIANLLTSLDGVYVDGTVGGGGHAEAILSRLSSASRLIGFDRDDDALRFAENRLQEFRPRVMLFRENFVNMRDILHENRIEAVNGVLFDLGLSSFQIDHPGKGFSFQRDEPLDMRMDRRQKLTAASLLRNVDEQALRKILSDYGEEFQAKRIARMIVSERRKHPIETTGSLVSVVRKVVRGRFVNKSLARVFQALRIAVNDELNNLKKALFNALEVLKPGGRLVVISYHSLEDRIVKEFFRAEAGTAARGIDGQRIVQLRIITKKPVTPTDQEIALNNRARSAKLRVAERL